MKNVSNTYGYYLTEDSETIELQGNFKENFIYLPTKDPKEQLNYKVFVSPKKNVNFAIQIVGGDNPQTIYIPQHIYKDLDFAYYENNPYYIIRDITVIKLDFTDTGNKLITYLKTKFEKGTGGLSKLAQAGVNSVDNYAGFSTGGQPIDEDILKQILFLFDEQNDVIFVDKNVKLVDESVVKERNYKSTRIKGNFAYTSNYFDSAGKFKEGILNSTSNIKLETTTGLSVSQLNDFVKDFAGSSLTEINSIYKTNIVKDTIVANAPKVLGLVMSGISQVAPLVKGTLDKIAQFKKQNAQKKLEEAKSIGGIKEDATAGITSPKGLFSTPSSLVSKYQDSVTLPATNTNKTTTPPAVSTPRQVDPKIKEIQDKFNAEQDEIRMRERAARLSGLDDSYDEDEFGNRTYDDPADTLKYQNTLANIKKKATLDRAEESLMNIKTTPKATSIKTISTVGNVSQAEGQLMIKNAPTSTASSIKQINADFLKF